MQTDPDLDPIRDREQFKEILESAKADRRYAAIWQTSKLMSSTESHGLDPETHRSRMQELVAQGFRPASISVAAIEPGESPVAASVWHRPLSPHAAREAAGHGRCAHEA